MRESKIKLHIGTSSFVVIFVTLCLVVFSVLSYVSSNANKNMSDRAIQQINTYYALCDEAYQNLETIDMTLQDLFEQSQNQEEYYQLVNTQYPLEENTYTFTIDGDEQSLIVSILIQYPEVGETFYEVQDWYKVSNQEWQPENNIDLM